MSNFFTYILTNPKKTVLYTGMTNNLEQRLIEHYLNRGKPKTFAGRYYCYYLIYWERYRTSGEAIKREKEIKEWNRKLKEELINQLNASWKFLNNEIMDWPPNENVASRSLE